MHTAPLATGCTRPLPGSIQTEIRQDINTSLSRLRTEEGLPPPGDAWSGRAVEWRVAGASEKGQWGLTVVYPGTLPGQWHVPVRRESREAEGKRRWGVCRACAVRRQAG